MRGGSRTARPRVWPPPGLAARRRRRRDGLLPGESAVALASTAGSLIAIKPHAGLQAGDRGRQKSGDADFEAFQANLATPASPTVSGTVRKFSSDAHQDVSGPCRCRCCTWTAPTASGRRGRERPARGGLARRARRRDARARRVLVDTASRCALTVRLVPALALRRADRLAGRIRAGVASGPRDLGGVRARTALRCHAQRADQGAGGDGRGGGRASGARPSSTLALLSSRAARAPGA